jgi:RNA polymerase sigma-70 factor (ECF subfamily)
VEHGLHDLIVKAKEGDKRAFTILVERYKKQVFYQAYGMLNDTQEAEDVAQEAFIKAYFSLKQLKSPYAFVSWLNRIVYHLCQDRLKKRKQEVIIRWQEGQICHVNDSADLIEQKQLQLDLNQALAALTPEHRAVLLMREIQGLTYHEIAEILGVPEGTVKSRIHKARLALRNRWQNEGG